MKKKSVLDGGIKNSVNHLAGGQRLVGRRVIRGKKKISHLLLGIN